MACGTHTPLRSFFLGVKRAVQGVFPIDFDIAHSDFNAFVWFALPSMKPGHSPLLAFHPQFLMKDLPVTPRSQARACLKGAREAGLKNIHVGNIHLIPEEL